MLALAKHPLVDKYNLSSLRVLSSGADKLKTEVAKLVEAKFPHVIASDGYGMSELSPVVASQALAEAKRSRGSVGKLVASTSAIVLDTENNGACFRKSSLDVTALTLFPSSELGVGEMGELLFTGPQMMTGYWRNAEATRSAFYTRPSDGTVFYRTGDVGVVDSDGNITVSHRCKDVIKAKGYQISPAELEEVLSGDPRVQDVAVIGVVDLAKDIQKPWAFLVASPGSTQEPVALQQLSKSILDAANQQLAAYKAIAGATFLVGLPKR